MPVNEKTKDIMELHCDRCNVWGSHYYSREQDKYICKVCCPVDNQPSPSKELDAHKGGDLSGKLLPCPFCNCKDIRIEGDDSDKYLWRWCGVYCSSCGITYSRKNLPNDSGRQSAIKSWNTRAPSQQLTTTQQSLDSAVEALKESKSLLEQYWDEWDTYDTCGYLGIPVYDETVRIIKQIEAALASIKE